MGPEDPDGERAPKESGLMPGLLRQPGGFEGFLGAGEEANPKQLSVFDLNDCPDFLVELDGACATPKMKLAKRDNIVAFIPPVVHGEPPFLELLVDLIDPLLNTFESAIRLSPEAAHYFHV